MDIYTYLRNDHRKVAELMEKVMAAKDASTREDLFRTIDEELSIHADTEEKTFYRALKEKGDEEVREEEEHAEHEHEEMRALLAECRKGQFDSQEWLDSFEELKEAVEHHVEEEEGEIFDQAREVLSADEARTLAEEMDALKEQLPATLTQRSKQVAS